jgi:hypothetical protein
MRRSALLISIVALASLGLAVPVLAAAPSSDLYATRTTIATLPFSESVDTTEATTDADDAEAAVDCGAPATDASVWYQYAATSDAGILVDTNSSTYPAGVIVASGGPGSFAMLTCGPGEISVPTTTGETYAILVFDYQGDGGGNGGTLNISVTEVPPPPVLDVTIAPTGHFNAKTGTATIHGTLSCTGGDVEGKNFIDVLVEQSVGRFRFSGEGFTTFACDGTTHTWSAEVFSSTGKFAGGKAKVTMFAVASGSGGGDYVDATATVTLKK